MAQLPSPKDSSNNNNDDEEMMDNKKEEYDVAVCRQLVKDFGIAIIPGSFCGFPGWIRVCYANLPPIQCKLAAQRLQEGLQAICG